VAGVELRLKKRDGTPIWGSFTARNVRNARGEAEYVDGIMEDITHRKQAEQALRESERRLSSLIDLMPDTAFVIDGNGVVVAWNRATEVLTGVKAEEMLGNPSPTGTTGWRKATASEQPPSPLPHLRMPTETSPWTPKCARRCWPSDIAEEQPCTEGGGSGPSIPPGELRAPSCQFSAWKM
jgi:hypothetical protein